MPGLVPTKRMNKVDEYALLENTQEIVNVLCTSDVITPLGCYHIISRGDKYEIQQGTTREERTMALINILVRRDCDTLARFIMILREKGYQDLASKLTRSRHNMRLFAEDEKRRTCQDEQYTPKKHQIKFEEFQRNVNEKLKHLQANIKMTVKKEVKQCQIQHNKGIEVTNGEYHSEEKDKLLEELSNLFDNLERKLEDCMRENSGMKTELTKLRAEFEDARERNDHFWKVVQIKRKEREIFEETFWKVVQDKREETKKFEEKMIIELDTLMMGKKSK